MILCHECFRIKAKMFISCGYMPAEHVAVNQLYAQSKDAIASPIQADRDCSAPTMQVATCKLPCNPTKTREEKHEGTYSDLKCEGASPVAFCGHPQKHHEVETEATDVIRLSALVFQRLDLIVRPLVGNKCDQLAITLQFNSMQTSASC
jgi:hypothetical protein